MAKKNVFVIKEDKEIVEGVFLCKGDMLIESGKGRWTIIEAEGDEEDEGMEKKDEAEGGDEDKKEESEDGDEDDEDKKEESEADKKKMAALRAKKESRK